MVNLSTVIWGNSISAYLGAFFLFAIILLAFRFFKYVGLKSIKKATKKTKTEKDDLIIDVLDTAIGWILMIYVSLYFAFKVIELSPKTEYWTEKIMFIVIAYSVVKGILAILEYAKTGIRKKKGTSESFLNLWKIIFSFIIWIFAFLVVLSNLGFNVTTLIAGLGIGGLAIALALQTVLSDLFASISIQLDKPFEEGDFIIIGDTMGTIKKIGIKTTRLESLWGQEVVVSNQELTSVRINNYKKMEKRRIQFDFGVTYNTPNKKLKKIKEITAKAIKPIKLATLDRVHFKAYDDSSLKYEVVYYIDSSDYNKYMDIQEEINFSLKEAFEKEKIEFAFPTRTVYMKK